MSTKEREEEGEEGEEEEEEEGTCLDSVLLLDCVKRGRFRLN